MALRRDVGLPQINNFPKFDRGEEVTQLVRGEFTFGTKDWLEWEAGCNVSGYADVVSAEPPEGGWTWVTLKKR